MTGSDQLRSARQLQLERDRARSEALVLAICESDHRWGADWLAQLAGKVGWIGRGRSAAPDRATAAQRDGAQQAGCRERAG
ncbi:MULTISPECIES: hypothetical protein [Rhodopseudomonas]|uniref:Uncharacterized protein n=1 Tax=Rhodopseudomonas palustris TaxID=1076 RepID=A0A0D7EAQ5_RHOPL|nr:MULTISPECIES: hypothetical protein [Rhodopseudomonas]KIZ37696.1 hypothetical protein OO17_23395 [Rhodopseudomonas palustris]MDF3813016.1 hypothetical protein [Rhodopseudomonas sp. BAL398]WOK20217.1 hypothetical protein RBJ75_12165 [Rhodopseudomonas sp. BAL398]